MYRPPNLDHGNELALSLIRSHRAHYGPRDWEAKNTLARRLYQIYCAWIPRGPSGPSFEEWYSELVQTLSGADHD